MDFGQRLKNIRNSRNMTQAELGQKLNVTNVSISGYESGTRSPDPETLLKIADIFHVSVDYLLGKTDEKLDLKDLLQNDVMTYGGSDLTEKDRETIKRVIGAVLGGD